MARLLVDAAQIRTFSEAIFAYASTDAIVSLRVFVDGADAKPLSIVPVVLNGAGLNGLVAEAVSAAQFAADHGKKAVFCPPIAGFSDRANATEAALAEGYAIVVDGDQKPAEARRRLEGVLGPATLIVASGGLWREPGTGEMQPKLHLYWRLTEPATGGDLKKLKRARLLATQLVGGDLSNVPIVHPLRWPGSWHRKGPPRMATIVARSGHEIDLGDALESLEAVAPEPEPEQPAHAGPRDDRDGDPRPTAVLIANITSGREFHPSIAPLAARLVGGGMPGAAVVTFIRGLMEEIPPEGRDQRWRDRIADVPRAVRTAEAKWSPNGGDAPPREPPPEPPREPPPEPPRGQPAPFERVIIEVRKGQIARTIDVAEAALLASGQPVFERGRMLVYPIVSALPASDNRKTDAVLLKRMVPENVIYQLNKYAAAFTRYDGRLKKTVPIDPPKDVARGLLSKGQWSFPTIAGVITVPTMRPDGTILDTPGFDAATQRLYLPDRFLAVPPIKARPTKSDALAALGLLQDLLREFPFVSALDRAVALAGLLMPVLRAAFAVAPMLLFRAPASGTGKSFLMDLLSTIATGRPCPVITYVKEKDEMEKRLGALVLQGAPLISLDNCESDIGGELLCQMTTQEIFPIRILGTSDMPECAWGGTLGATGNNIGVYSDMARRVLIANLDADMERPEQRWFKHDPVGTILADRGRYIAACLTIARAWRVAGEPGHQDVPPIAGYGAWAKAVRLPLLWLGQSDVATSMDEAHEDDPNRANARALFELVWEHFGQANQPLPLLDNPASKPFTTPSLIQKAAELLDEQPAQRALHDLLVARCGARAGSSVEPKRLGYWLKAIRGQVHGGFRLDVIRKDTRQGAEYVLRPKALPRPEARQA